MTKLKAFTFEMMLYIGKILGTKHKLFTKLFLEDKAYLMGKIITVDTALRSFKDAMVPFYVT